MKLSLFSALFLVLLIAACDSNTSPEEEQTILSENSFIIQVTEGDKTSMHEGAVSAETQSYEYTDPDSVLIDGTSMTILLQFSAEQQTYFRLVREADSREALATTGEFDLSGATSESSNAGGFQAMYVEYQGANEREFALCESGTVIFTSFTENDTKGSFTCASATRVHVDASGNETTLQQPISLSGAFFLSFAFAN